MGKGKLPVTERLILENEESQWRLLTRGLINELPTSALVEMSPGHKVRIKLVIKTIIPPECNFAKTRTWFESNLDSETCSALARSDEFFSDLMRSTMWTMIGYIEGEEKKPIFINHYSSINISIYTQKLISEETDEFSPFKSCLN